MQGKWLTSMLNKSCLLWTTHNKYTRQDMIVRIAYYNCTKSKQTHYVAWNNHTGINKTYVCGSSTHNWCCFTAFACVMVSQHKSRFALPLDHKTRTWRYSVLGLNWAWPGWMKGKWLTNMSGNVWHSDKGQWLWLCLQAIYNWTQLANHKSLELNRIAWISDGTPTPSDGRYDT
jgi:hypothetical protein